MKPIDAARSGLVAFMVPGGSQDGPAGPQVQERETAVATGAAPAGTASTRVGDPLLTSVAQAKLSQSAAPAAKQAGINVPPEVAEILAEGAKNPDAKKEFTTAQQALAAGDYRKAYEAMESLMRKQGEDVLTEDQVKSAQTVRDQLGFLADMRTAGIKADYPPTEAQLVKYFKTLKDKPAAARQAFEAYTENFHVHPGNVKGEDPDIKYSQTKVKRGQSEYTTDVPHEWSDVSKRTAKGSLYAGRQMNDCQGYAFIGEKLLGAAGFKVAHNIAAMNGTKAAHAMVLFTHPKEKGYTLTTNDKTYHGSNPKALAQEGFGDVVGKEKLTGKEHYYTGKTQTDAEIECAIKDNEL
jgi:hypothetical protein